jgi:hypothetical protein
VQLVIASDSIEPAEMSRVLGIKPDRETWIGQVPQGFGRRRPALDNSWEIRESGDSSADISALIDALFTRVQPVAEGVRQLRDRGCRVIVSVVLYVAPGDPTGSGFSLGATNIEFLSSTGAEFEVDQYIDV